MTPVGKIPVTIQLKDRQYKDDIHTCLGISGALILWKAAKELRILPPYYPYPQVSSNEGTQPEIKTTMIGNNIQIATEEQIMLEFPSVFDGQVRTMKSEKFDISVMEEAVPFCVFTYREKLKAELELLQEQGIITPVKEVTEWCGPIVVTPKKDSERIRMCVDLSRLNHYVKRERYQSPNPAEAVADIAAEEACYFTVLDAMKGYYQCPLDKESQGLTTFITPYGRFKYL